jgi:ADP-ribosylglycohydrolase
MEATTCSIVGCLQGIATGDAIGKQTEGLSHEAIRHWYPTGLRGFEGAPGSIIPRYIGNAKREWRIGETTDDTERTVAVARAILADRDVRHVTVGRELLACVKCVHPGVKSLWAFHQAGDPTRIAEGHSGCGAAVRVAPVGMFYRSGRLEEIVRAARETSISTHNASPAIAAAAAVAAAVSAAIDGATASEILEHGLRAATLSERLWAGRVDGALIEAIRRAHDHLSATRNVDPAAMAASLMPIDTVTIVPFALALGTVLDSAEEAILIATNTGGDTDSVASIAGGLLGARFPATVNADWAADVERVNGHDVIAVGTELSILRH